jgi:ribosome biogenesis protein SSF1/2
MRTWSLHLNVSTHLTQSDVAFVIKRGRIGMYTKELLNDTRDLLYPYTALKLKESKKNSIKDFISVAGQFGVSHMLIFSQTDKSCYLRLLKNPKGPTITFKIDEYSLAKDVVKF